MSSLDNDDQLTALIIDDQKSICETLTGVLNDEGWFCYSANSGEAGITLFSEVSPDLIFIDVWMAEVSGIEVLKSIKNQNNIVPIIIMSGHATIETAVQATKIGAFEFFEKPLSLKKILPILNHAEMVKNMSSKKKSRSFVDSHLVGESPLISSIHRQIKVVAPRNSWVLITGENGTGKEVVARNLHLNSKRAENPFVAVNCAAIPEDLIESELFGYHKDILTNSLDFKQGKFHLAHKGTLFLDEIGDMSLKTQAKILRILQEQSFEPIGACQSVSIDVRVIAATNKNLPEQIIMGKFREDLYYRLNVIPIHMPPLRERLEDILVLAKYFLDHLGQEFKETPKEISPSALSSLCRYNWPGNVRELKNIMERLMIMVPGNLVTGDDILKLIELGGKLSQANSMSHNGKQLSLKEAKNRFERSFLVEELERHDWNISRTAESINVERSNLHRKLRAYDIDPKRLKL